MTSFWFLCSSGFFIVNFKTINSFFLHHTEDTFYNFAFCNLQTLLLFPKIDNIYTMMSLIISYFSNFKAISNKSIIKLIYLTVTANWFSFYVPFSNTHLFLPHIIIVLFGIRYVLTLSPILYIIIIEP